MTIRVIFRLKMSNIETSQEQFLQRKESLFASPNMFQLFTAPAEWCTLCTTFEKYDITSGIGNFIMNVTK